MADHPSPPRFAPIRRTDPGDLEALSKEALRTGLDRCSCADEDRCESCAATERALEQLGAAHRARCSVAVRRRTLITRLSS